MRRPASRVATAGLAVAALGLGMVTVAGGTASGEGKADLARVRAATAKYHDVDAAVADGFQDLDLCFPQMGEHYAQTGEIDGTVEDAAPEALVYAHVGDRLKLVAVEYVATGPGEVLGQPLHFNPTVQLWVLHAWVWMHNADGMHADNNPAVGDCPQ